MGTDLDLCPREEMESSIAFKEYYAPKDCIHGIGGIILVTATARSGVTVVRGGADGPFGEPEKVILRALMPHLRRAALLHGELGSFGVRNSPPSPAIWTDTPHAFLLTDAEGRVLYANTAARELVDLKDGLAIETGRISLLSPRLELGFRKALSTIASGRDASMQRLEVIRPSRGTPYRLMLMPVQASGVIPLGVFLPAIAVLIVDSESQPEPDPSVLRELFSLTPAEARVAAKLARGRNVGKFGRNQNLRRNGAHAHQAGPFQDSHGSTRRTDFSDFAVGTISRPLNASRTQFR